MSSKPLTLFAATALAWAVGAPAVAQDGPTLAVGDPAPKIEVKEFVKGQEIQEFAKGKTYVVEFWATWCGPCRTSIPHLTELQHQYKDVPFLGVSVWEQDQSGVKPFVEEMGDKMDYAVAMDAVPEGADGNQGAMARTWMTAAGRNGIPSAFIVNGDGLIAWVGHPMSMDKPLAKIVAGDYDIAEAIAEAEAEAARAQKMAALRTKLTRAQRSGDSKALVAVIDEAIADDAAMEMALGTMKFQALAKAEPDKAAEYGKRLVETVLSDEPMALNNFAWGLVDPEAASKPTPALLEVALAAARRADELTGSKDPAVSDTLAKALFDSGKAVEALEAQERAVRFSKGTPFEQDASMKERLETYRKAAGVKS